MAATLDTTIGGTKANSYVTLEEFAEWAETRYPSTAYDAATPEQRTRALIAAARRLDQESFQSVPTHGDQALQWPRFDAEDRDRGIVYAPDEIPARIKRAQMELAYQILASNYTPDDTGLEQFDRVRLGSLEVSVNHARSTGRLPEDVLREIRPLLRSGFGIRLLRG